MLEQLFVRVQPIVKDLDNTAAGKALLLKQLNSGGKLHYLEKDARSFIINDDRGEVKNILEIINGVLTVLRSEDESEVTVARANLGPKIDLFYCSEDFAEKSGLGLVTRGGPANYVTPSLILPFWYREFGERSQDELRALRLTDEEWLPFDGLTVEDLKSIIRKNNLELSSRAFSHFIKRIEKHVKSAKKLEKDVKIFRPDEYQQFIVQNTLTAQLTNGWTWSAVFFNETKVGNGVMVLSVDQEEVEIYTHHHAISTVDDVEVVGRRIVSWVSTKAKNDGLLPKWKYISIKTTHQQPVRHINREGEAVSRRTTVENDECLLLSTLSLLLNIGERESQPYNSVTMDSFRESMVLSLMKRKNGKFFWHITTKKDFEFKKWYRH